MVVHRPGRACFLQERRHAAFLPTSLQTLTKRRRRQSSQLKQPQAPAGTWPTLVATSVTVLKSLSRAAQLAKYASKMLIVSGLPRRSAQKGVVKDGFVACAFKNISPVLLAKLGFRFPRCAVRAAWYSCHHPAGRSSWEKTLSQSGKNMQQISLPCGVEVVMTPELCCSRIGRRNLRSTQSERPLEHEEWKLHLRS